jgi:hypothetical protein
MIDWRHASEDLPDSCERWRHDLVPLPLDVSEPLSATSMVRVHCNFGAPTAVRYNFSAVLRWRTLISREMGSQ